MKITTLYAYMGFTYMGLGLISTSGYLAESPAALIANHAWAILYILPVNYAFFESALPALLKIKGRPIHRAGAALAVIIVFGALYSYGSYSWRLLGSAISVYHPMKELSVHEMLISQLVYSGGSLAVFGIIRHINAHVRLLQHAQRLKIARQEAELSYLRSQINPHFLFNTLNNIYALNAEHNAVAGSAILRLADILRFTLYEAELDSISLELEIKVIRDYLELEKLRYGDELRIGENYSVDTAVSLPPLLLLPLIENAFKHGVSAVHDSPFIDISLQVKGGVLLFRVVNAAAGGPGVIKENIGLSNLRRRLGLLYTDHRLSAGFNGKTFTAELQLNLSSRG